MLGQRPEQPCHNDLLNANFIRSPAGIRIVDWEYAGMGDRFFDLANFSVNHELTEEEERLMLEAYFGELRDTDAAHLRVMRFMSDFREAMWGVVQQGISELDFDFVGYARQHFERLAQTAASDTFRRALGSEREGPTHLPPPTQGEIEGRCRGRTRTWRLRACCVAILPGARERSSAGAANGRQALGPDAPGIWASRALAQGPLARRGPAPTQREREDPRREEHGDPRSAHQGGHHLVLSRSGRLGRSILRRAGLADRERARVDQR